MNDLDKAADEAEVEITAAKQRCEDLDYDRVSKDELWAVFRKWISHPEFGKDFNPLEVSVLNALEFTLSVPKLMDEGWALISELAARWEREGNSTMKESLRIASFEIAAETPEYPPTLELLFSLARNDETRWGVFAAYENFPWRLRAHAGKYSGGTITDQDCDEWLTARGHCENTFPVEMDDE